jgi:hypothetical protein
MNTNLYINITTAITIIGTFFMPWWSIPIALSIVSFFHNGNSIKSFLISFLIPSFIWILIVIVKDGSHVNKVAALTGDIIGGISPSAIYVTTGLILGMVSGLASLIGRRLGSDFRK